MKPRRPSRTRSRLDNASGFHGFELPTIGQPEAPFVGVRLPPSHDAYGQATGPPTHTNRPETYVTDFRETAQAVPSDGG